MSDKTPREYAKETAERWTNASKREKWGDISPGDVHNMLDTMIDGFEALEAELAIALEALDKIKDRCPHEEFYELCDCSTDMKDMAITALARADAILKEGRDE